ncbi:MAG: 6,7-dimethyl-8-ribityllumazine synthase [Proteobacteria bacterium]|nr:6,7-dimethyl-8-ribityllumazine synthase [Pseudomonadota bacterium]
MPILIVETNGDVAASADSIGASVVYQILDAQRILYEHIKVSHIGAVAPTAWVGLDSVDYEGLIVIGGILEGDTHDMALFHECARNIHDVAMQHSIALGFGLVTANNKKALQEKIVAASGQAALSCVEVLRIIDHYRLLIGEPDDVAYQN